MTHLGGRLAALIVCCALLPSLAAGIEDPRRCASRKLFAVARADNCYFIEQSDVPPVFAPCDAKLSSSFASAETKFDYCPMMDEDAEVLTRIAQASASLATALAGGPAATARFVDNGDGTVTDTVSGLMWEQLGDDGSLNDRDATLPWGSAISGKIAALNGAAFAGHSDWRLPNLNELQSIAIVPTHQRDDADIAAPFEAGCTPGCAPTTCGCMPVTPTAIPFYWSSTTVHSIPDQAWAVGFNDGGYLLPLDKTTPSYVRAVRGGL